MNIALMEASIGEARMWKEIDELREYVQRNRANWLADCKNKSLREHYERGGTYDRASVYIGRYTHSVTFSGINAPDPVIMAMRRSITKLWGYATVQQGNLLRVYLHGHGRD